MKMRAWINPPFGDMPKGVDLQARPQVGREGGFQQRFSPARPVVILAKRRAKGTDTPFKRPAFLSFGKNLL
jgi:hypothetical protein